MSFNRNDVPDDADTGQPVLKTEPPIREFVVREPDPTRVGPEAVKRSPLRWLWWLLALLALGLALWWFLRPAAQTNVACTSVPDNIFAGAQVQAINTLEQWIPGVAAQNSAAAATALRTLCNHRLANGSNWYLDDAVQTEFTNFAPNLEPGAITNIENLVNGDTFCRCS